MLPFQGAPERRMRGGHPSSKAPVSRVYGGALASVGGLYEKERAGARRWGEKHDLCHFPDSYEV